MRVQTGTLGAKVHGRRAWRYRERMRHDEELARGRALRQQIPRRSQSTFVPDPGRSPLGVLTAQETTRLPELVGLRRQRMTTETDRRRHQGYEERRRTMSSLKELQDLIHDKYGLEGAALDPDASMKDTGLDSLALAEFLFAVEDHFAISLPDDDPDVDTLRKLADLVDQVKAAKTAPTT